MNSPSKDQPNRVRVRIPWLIEFEGEGLVAVIGGLGLTILAIVLLAAHGL